MWPVEPSAELEEVPKLWTAALPSAMSGLLTQHENVSRSPRLLTDKPAMVTKLCLC